VELDQGTISAITGRLETISGIKLGTVRRIRLVTVSEFRSQYSRQD